jgi:hypothetical protein
MSLVHMAIHCNFLTRQILCYCQNPTVYRTIAWSTGFVDGGRGFSIAFRNATLNNADGSNWCIASTLWAPKRDSGRANDY